VPVQRHIGKRKRVGLHPALIPRALSAPDSSYGYFHDKTERRDGGVAWPFVFSSRTDWLARAGIERCSCASLRSNFRNRDQRRGHFSNVARAGQCRGGAITGRNDDCLDDKFDNEEY
jgi:hypothetical protein